MSEPSSRASHSKSFDLLLLLGIQVLQLILSLGFIQAQFFVDEIQGEAGFIDSNNSMLIEFAGSIKFDMEIIAEGHQCRTNGLCLQSDDS